MDSSREYEEHVLGCILLDNRVLDEYPISDVMFEYPISKRVYELIVKTRARGAVANILEVGLMAPDIASEVASMTDMPSVANVKFYIDLLTEAAMRRGINRMSRTATEMSLDKNTEVDYIFTFIERQLMEITKQVESGYKPLSYALEIATTEIKKACDSKGNLTGLHTGFPSLDDKTNGWQPQELIVIGARPGAGKTAIALNMASAAVKEVPVGFVSAEMSAASLAKRLYADWANVDYGKLRSGFMSGEDIRSIGVATDELLQQRFFVNDKPSISLRELVSDARRMKRNENIGILFVDYLSLVENNRKDAPRHEQVAEIAHTLKGLARELNIPIVVLSQLTRAAQNARPQLSQLRESGSVEQDADIVILLYAQGYTDATNREVKVTLIVEKNRAGSVGDVSMIFKAPRMRFVEHDKEW